MVGVSRRYMAFGACALALGTFGCVGSSERGSASVDPGARPDRIVSLIPAATEILFAIGAGDRLAGRTRWGVYPPEAAAVPDVGDGVRPSLEAILARDPDLVILYHGAANAGVAERLESLGVRTLVLRHDTFADLARNIGLLGRVTGCDRAADRLLAKVRRDLARIRSSVRPGAPVRVYYDAWAEPPITIGAGSFLDSLLAVAGAENIFGELQTTAPRVSLEAIVRRDPAWIVTTAPADSLDIAPRLDGRPGWGRISAVREGRIAVVDRDLVGRLGPRAADAAAGIARALGGDPPRLDASGMEAKCAG